MSEDSAKPPPPTPAFERAWHFLETAGWLADLDAEKRRTLRNVARSRACSAGDYLYLPGDQPDGVYGLVQGTLDILIPRLDGVENLVHRAEAGFWVGDLALFARQRRLVGVRASTNCTLVYLAQDKLKRAIRAHPGLIADFYMLTHANMEMALRLLGVLAVPGAEKRVALRLLIQSDLLAEKDRWMQLSQDSIAELVALSQQSVRRALRGLQSRGLVAVGYARVRIIDREALAAFCHYSPNRHEKNRKRTKDC